MIFQYGSEPVLIQRILIGLEAILEIVLRHKEKVKGCVEHNRLYIQELKGIRQWPIKFYTSPMIKHKITPFVDYNYWLKRLDTQLYEQTNQNY